MADGDKKKRGSWNLFGSATNDAAMVSPLLNEGSLNRASTVQLSPVAQGSYVQDGGKPKGRMFSLKGIFGGITASRAVPTTAEAHDMYSRMASDDYEDEDSASSSFLSDGNKGNSVEMTVPRSAAEKSKINSDALDRQRQNNEAFMQQMREEEDRAIADFARKKKEEEESLKLAMRLQAEEEAYARQSPPRRGVQQPPLSRGGAPPGQKRVVVPVPDGAYVGQVLNVSVPGVGIVPVKVPPGAISGQALEFFVALTASGGRETKKVQLVVPANSAPGQRVTVQIPGLERHIEVEVPAGAQPGDTIEFNVDVPSDKVRPQVQNVAPTIDPDERKAFLDSLPVDMRNEILAQEQAQRDQLLRQAAPPQQQLVCDDEPEDTMSAAEKKAFYDALPPEMREEIMQQEIAQRRRAHSHSKAMAKPAPSTDPSVSPAVVVRETPVSGMASMNLTDNASAATHMFSGMDVKARSSFQSNPAFDESSAGPPASNDAPLLDFGDDDAVPPTAPPTTKLAPSESAPVAPPTSALAPPPMPPPSLVASDSTPPIVANHNPFSKPHEGPAPTVEAPLDRLRKAKALLSEGLIEQDEFDDIKRIVLAQLKGMSGGPKQQ